MSKRAGHAVGMNPSNQLAAHVHNNLVETAALTCKAVEAFGAAVHIANDECNVCKMYVRF